MATEYNPRVVTNGLLFYIDAANPRSYVGSGITVNGLISGVGATLVNGPGFGTTNNGFLIFDGVNDHATFNVAGMGNTITVELWAKIKSFHSTMPFGFFEYDVFTYLGGIGFNTNNSDVHGISSATVSGLGISSNWTHYVFEMRTDVSYTNNKMYINGNLQSLSQLIGTESAAKRTFNSGVGRISGYNANSSFAIPMDLGLFKFYNRSLSQQEINFNYNAIKKRYGL